MRALVFTAPGEVQLREEPEPVVGDGERLVHVAAAGICGSELHGFKSVGMRRPPLVMGHELVGVTDDGRRVVVNPLLTCGTCSACASGRPQVCERRQLIGVNRAGGFAERVAVPQRCLYDAPDALDDLAASLVEPLANAIHALGLAPADMDRVLVLGGGTIGLLCALAAQQRGLAVTVSELAPARQRVITALGLTVTERPEGVWPGVIDAVGSSATRALSVECLENAGTAVWLGLAEESSPVPGNLLVRFERRVLGSFAYTPQEFARAIDTAPDLDLTWASAVPLSESAEAFMRLAGGDTSVLKAVVVPDGRSRPS